MAEVTKKNAPWAVSVSERFALLNRLITRDLNTDAAKPVFSKFTKADIIKFLDNPAYYEKQLREAVLYIYGASPHFRRLIQYFTGLSDLSYVTTPYKIDVDTAKPAKIRNSYKNVLNILSSMNIKTQFQKILTVCLREDVFFGTMWVTKDNIAIQQLPSNYCAISTIEGNVLNVTFDFSYFTTNAKYLPNYPPEFAMKYEIYKADRKLRWQELDSPTSFCVKCNNDILAYAIPPFVGILREIFDIEDYKALKLGKTTLENYALLVMGLEMDEEGNYTLDLEVAKEYFRNLSSVLPEEIGAVLSPMNIEKIGFERTHPGDVNTIADAEQSLFTAAGVSSLLFNNEKASANALLLSIKADQSLTFGLVKSLEDIVNRYIQSKGFGKNFKVTFLDCSPFNRKELGDMYLKANQYGIPMISYYAASQGMSQGEMEGMAFLENEILGLHEKLVPLQGASTLSGNGATDEGGAPPKAMEELTESGEQNQEDS